MSGTQSVCECSAYRFPHRLGGGGCPGAFGLVGETVEEGRECSRCAWAKVISYEPGYMQLYPVYRCQVPDPEDCPAVRGLVRRVAA